MNLSQVILQLGGIDIASIRECEIRGLIEADILKQGFNVDDHMKVTVYINIEGTAVTAYYTCEECQGAVKINY